MNRASSSRAFILATAFSIGAAFAVSGCGGSADDTSEASAAYSAEENESRRVDSGGSASTNDGNPTRVACTSNFGSGLTAVHGRIDGYLVSVVPDSTRACNGDSQHLHLQVKEGGAVYDVAVNVDGFEAEETAPLPRPAWSEGFHAGEKLDYVNDLGLHSGAFKLTGLQAVRQQVETAIANANHVSIYATGYDHTGAHLVHRQGTGQDGAIFIDPLGPKPYVIAFRFASQSF